MDLDEQETKDRLSLGLSLFIALCVITLFCAISIAITRNMDVDDPEFKEYYSFTSSDNANNKVFF